MKKITALLLMTAFFMLCSCGASEEETTSEDITVSTEETSAEETTSTVNYTTEEMSPSEIDISLSIDVETNTADIPFSSYEEIDAKDSELPDSMCQKVLKSENAEYFFMDSENKILVIFFDEKNVPVYSACYDMESGALDFIGNDEKTWYYNADGSLNLVVYTFSFGKNNPPIYTFYDESGKKDVTRTMDGWYSADFTKLTEQEAFEYITKYQKTIEAITEY